MSSITKERNAKSALFFTVFFSTVFFVTVERASADTTTTVHNVLELVTAVNNANAGGGNATIILTDGTYTLSEMLPIRAPHITVRSQSGNRDAVILQGDAMSAGAVVKEIFWVDDDYFTAQDMTLQRVGWHAVQVVGEDNADFTTISNCVLRDAYEQIIKVSQNPSVPSVTGDGGIVENSLFDYTAGIGPEYYIGGIDIHGGNDWIIRGNTFRNIISPNTAVAEHAVHIWDTPASGNLVEKNTIINCDRGVGFGLGDRGATGGIIRNNMIYHAAGRGSFADVPIGLETSPNTQVYNNTIYLEDGYPNAIEYRWTATTGVLVANNLTNASIAARDGATGTIGNNVTNAQSSWFVGPMTGNLHLAATRASVVDAGQSVSGLTDDFDGQSRPIGTGIDMGADEYSAGDTTPPAAPTGLGVQ